MELDRAENFINRELSWLDFNMRVLNEARDRSVLLFERLKFLSITASNLDEFFMVRVASLKDMVNADYTKKDIAGMTAAEQLAAISEAAHHLVELQYSTYNRSLVPALEKERIRIIARHEEMNSAEAEYADRYFKEKVYPVLTPMAVDASRPFPLIRNKSLNIAALVKRRKEIEPLIKKEKSKKKNEEYKGYAGDGLDFAMVQVPGVIPRLVELPSEDERVFILLEEIIERNIDSLFLNYELIAAHPFRIMRNAELELDEEDAADLLEEIEKQLKKRQWGEAIRLEIEDGTDKRLLKILKDELDISGDDLYKIRGPLDLTVLMKLYQKEGFDSLKSPKHIPKPVPALMGKSDIFEAIREGDIFLSHPYQSFEPVVNFIKSAASDNKVLAIKQTLYRVSGNSPIIAALERAAENGKQVTVLVELKARFDEENNINWAKRLEKSGCHVIYGLVGLKTHSKITLVVRLEDDGIRRYVHLGTGNYNDSTAKLYTDLGILTCRSEYGEDATAVFNMLSGYSEPISWNRLIVAPLWMKDRFISLIRRTADAAREGRPAAIRAKMNSLSDKDIIIELYKAGMAGVSIDLIVRGICCLKAGIPGISENIRVRSIVGEFLEHARIFCFMADSNEEYYLGSADWMNRNLEKRVEIVFPVDDENIRNEIDRYLKIQLADNVKASEYADGKYKKLDLRGRQQLVAQEEFIKAAAAACKKREEELEQNKDERVFIPAEA